MEPAVPRPSGPRGLLSIPAVSDRAAGVDAGPRISVNAFRLQGAIERPDRRIHVADVQALCSKTRANHSRHAGTSIKQLQDVADKVTAYYRERGYILAQSLCACAGRRSMERSSCRCSKGASPNVIVEGSKGYQSPVLTRPFKEIWLASPSTGIPSSRRCSPSGIIRASPPLACSAPVATSAPPTSPARRRTRIVFASRRRSTTTTRSSPASIAAGVAHPSTIHCIGADQLRRTLSTPSARSTAARAGYYGGIDYEIRSSAPTIPLRFTHFTNAYEVRSNRVDSARQRRRHARG